MAKWCGECEVEHENTARSCEACGSSEWGFVRPSVEQPDTAFQEAVRKARKLEAFTVDSPKSFEIEEELGIVFGVSSKQAFWGLSKQSTRLAKAFDAALLDLKTQAEALGADAVVGVRFALNNSAGSSSPLAAVGTETLAGSSEAVVICGTPVRGRYLKTS